MNDITWTQGKQNMGGLKDHFYFVPLDEVDITATIAALTLAADGKTVSGDIALVALSKFGKIYFTKGTGKLDYTVVGERDGRSMEHMFEANIPGGEPDNMAVIDVMLNTPGIAIAKDSSGNQLLMGISKDENGILNVDFPAYLESIAGTTGAAAADKRGITLGVKSESPETPLVYTGTIDLDDLT